MDVRYTGLNHIFQSRTSDNVVTLEPGPTQTLHLVGLADTATAVAGVSILDNSSNINYSIPFATTSSSAQLLSHSNLTFNPSTGNENITSLTTSYNNKSTTLSNSTLDTNIDSFSLGNTSNSTELNEVQKIVGGGVAVGISGDGRTCARTSGSNTIISQKFDFSKFTPFPSITFQTIATTGSISFSSDGLKLLISNLLYTRIDITSQFTLVSTLSTTGLYSCMSRDGNTIVIGDPADHQAVFYYNGGSGNTYSLISTQNPAFADDFFHDYGGPITMDDTGTYICISYLHYSVTSGGSSYRGAVYTYTRSSSTVTFGQIIFPDAGAPSLAFNGFCTSMAGNGTRMAISGNPAVSYQKFFIYNNSAGTWTLYQTITSGWTPLDLAVQLSYDGLTCWVSRNNNSTMYIYKDSGSSFSTTYNYTIPDALGPKLGPMSTAKSDTQLVVGGPSDNSNIGAMFYLSGRGSNNLLVNYNTVNNYVDNWNLLGAANITGPLGLIGNETIVGDITAVSNVNIVTNLVVGGDETLAGNLIISGSTKSLFSHKPTGRLSLTTTIPVTTSDITSGNIFYVPYNGNTVWLYNGTFWINYIFTQLTMALVGASGTVADFFIELSGGIPTLTTTAWSSSTNRATNITYQDGLLVASGATNRLYIGTVCFSALNLVSDSENKRFLWNNYNRVSKHLSWILTTDTSAPAGVAELISGTSRMSFVVGFVEDSASCTLAVTQKTGTSAFMDAYIGLNSTSAATADSTYVENVTAIGITIVNLVLNAYPVLGSNFFSFLVTNGGTSWLAGGGSNVSGNKGQTGLFGRYFF